MSKHFFVGESLGDANDDPEFYSRNTVIDVPYGAGQDGLFTATYAQPVNRVKWEITENFLIARQTHEHINDSDHYGTKRTNNGQVVAMFRIQSHFDIRNSYNPGTGEEMNVVEENASDRPWYEREYIRVDWSRNEVTSGYEVDSLSMIGLYGGVKFDPMQYFVNEPNHPDAPVVDSQGGYFDITSKAFATPQMVDTPWGAFPACYFFGAHPVANCNPTELTLRLSFKKVVETDFEPTDWDGNRMDNFGAFYQDRYGYERNYGVTDQKWHRFADKYNIWERSHISQKSDGGAELFAQCNVDAWRDDKGDPMKFKVDGAGDFITDGTTGLPIPDPNGKTFTRTTIDTIAAREQNRWRLVDRNGNRTDDECEFRDASDNLLHPGARCDEFSRRCSMPLNERKTKTIPWYYAPGGPADLYPSTAFSLDQWNVAMKHATQLGMKVDAARVKAEAPEGLILTEDAIKADNDKPLYVGADGRVWDKTTGEAISQEAAAGRAEEMKKVPDILTLCHSPVLPNDPQACGEPGLFVRIGDLRYNTVNMVNTPQTPSPWGIMVDAVDPLTGEKVATSVNEWAPILDVASQGTVDLLRWINGEISESDITTGRYMQEWAAGSQLGTKQFRPQTLSTDEIKSRLASIHPANLIGGDANVKQLPANTKLSNRQINELLNVRSKQASQALGPSLDAEFEAQRKHLIGSKFEAMLATPEWKQAAGIDPEMPLAESDPSLGRASLLRGQHPEMRRWLDRLRGKAMATKAFCQIEQPEPDSLVGLARQAQKLFPLPNRQDKDFAAKKHARDRSLFQWIREQFHIAVILHEMGHSMSLRHNFTGSFDSLNYHTEYWQLRTRNGAERGCEFTDGNAYPLKSHTNGEDCVGPRWIDPVTDTEVNGLIWKWGSTTVMDYPGDLSQDMNDLGKYDKAAIRFMYADLVDVDVDATDSQNSAKAGLYPDLVDGFGGISGPLLNNHYSEYNDLLASEPGKNNGVIGDCTAQKDPKDPLSAKCTGFKLDHVKLFDMRDCVSQQVGTSYQCVPKALGSVAPPGERTTSFMYDPQGRARHPYMFGSDEYADTGNLPVFRFDAGADGYEQMQFIVSTYENRYIFDNFRRNRVQFTSGGTIGRAMGRYFDKMTASPKAIALYLSILPDLRDLLTSRPGYLMSNAIAGADSLSTFARVLTRPEPGEYQLVSGTKYAEVADNRGVEYDPSTSFRIALGSGEGRYLHNEYDYSKGYNWGRYQTQVGSYYEKVAMVYYMLEAYNHFVQNSKRDYIDGRFLNLNYASVYPDQVRRLFSSIYQSDPMALGPYVSVQQGASAESTIAHVQYLPWEKWNEKEPGTTSPAYPPNSIVLNPLVGWEQQYPAMIYSYMFGATTMTMDWIQQMRIFTPGGTDGIGIDPSELVRYTDPLTGVIYAARNYGRESIAGKTVFRSGGARMIQYANELAKKAFVVTGEDPQSGALTFQRDGVTNEPVCLPALDALACSARKAEVRRWSANLDTLRQLAVYMGYGPIGRE